MGSEHEQLLFERRLCDPESEGIAVKKINQHGKSAIRHVRCLPLDPDHPAALLHHQGPDGSTATPGGANRSCSSSWSASGWSGGTSGGARSSSGASWGGGTGGGGGGTNASSSAAVVGRMPSPPPPIRGSSNPNAKGGGGGGPNHHINRQYTRVPSSEFNPPKNSESPPKSQQPLLPPLPRSSPPLSSSSAAAATTGHTGVTALSPGYALVWGKRKGVWVPLERFVAVRKGKVTPRSKRNAAPPSRILSLVTNDPDVHLDIEAPTKLDRDRFARAFSAFLRVPLLQGTDDPPPGGGGSHPHHPPLPTHLQWTGNPVHSEEEKVDVVVVVPNHAAAAAATSASSTRPLTVAVPGTTPPPHASPPHHHPRPLPPLAQSSASAGAVTALSPSSTAPPTSSSLPPPTPPHVRTEEAQGDWKAAVAPLAGSSAPLSHHRRASTESSSPATTTKPREDSTAPLSNTSHDDHDEDIDIEYDDMDDELEALAPLGAGGGVGGADPKTNPHPPLPSRHRGAPHGPPSSTDHGAAVVPQAQSRSRRSAAPPNDRHDDRHHHDDDASEDEEEASSVVSSLTGHHPHYDPELVEELHQALNDMRAQLEEARAEAARAVKVAEQAITSAERNATVPTSAPPSQPPAPTAATAASSSSVVGDVVPPPSPSSPPQAASGPAAWQNTVTHKAAEAAALAQKRCAEALARQRLAEERLDGERRTAQFWRKQAEVAEEEAGLLQTRAAQAEVQRAALQAQLDSERRVAAHQWQARTEREDNRTEVANNTAAALEAALERNKWLELELERTRRELDEREAEWDARNRPPPRKGARLLLRGSSDQRLGLPLPKSERASSSGSVTSQSSAAPSEPPHGYDGQVVKLQAQAASVREQFELLRIATADQLRQWPQETRHWAEQVARALQSSLSEAEHLRHLWAHEHASRRKLLHEVQDLRGRVRVYCRPRPDPAVRNPLLSLASHDTVVFHRDRVDEGGSATDADPFGGATLSFAFDRAFRPDTPQHDVYTEVEDTCLSVLEGYNVCVVAFGQTGTGKTHTLLGDIAVPEPGTVRIDDRGIQLRTLEQIFDIAEHRADRYRDTFTLSLVEVFNERLTDLVAGTPLEERGEVVIVATDDKKSKKKPNKDDDAARQTKLEIRTDLQGETVVQGLLALQVSSYDELCEIWNACILQRRNRLRELGLDPIPYEAASHTIATLKVVSSNVATGIGTVGKIQFVDLGGADLVPRTFDITSPKVSIPHQNVFASITGDKSEWKFANRSLDTLNDVILARAEYTRSVPYRHSTLTHLLMDSLEHDTKLLVFACVSTDPKDAQETATTLRFASLLSKVTVGKATKHIIQPS